MQKAPDRHQGLLESWRQRVIHTVITNHRYVSTVGNQWPHVPSFIPTVHILRACYVAALPPPLHARLNFIFRGYKRAIGRRVRKIQRSTVWYGLGVRPKKN